MNRPSSTAASARPSEASALYAVPEGRPVTAKVGVVERDLGDLLHPALPPNPILAPRSVKDGMANFGHERRMLALDRGGLLPPNPKYKNPTLAASESSYDGGERPISIRKEHRMLQMGAQGLNPPKNPGDGLDQL